MNKKITISKLLNLVEKSPLEMKRSLRFNAVATIEQGTRKYSYDFGKEEYSFFVKTNKIVKLEITYNYRSKGSQSVDFHRLKNELLKMGIRIIGEGTKKGLIVKNKEYVFIINRDSEELNTTIEVSKK